MKIKNKKIAFGLTNVFYAFKPTINEIEKLVLCGSDVTPIISSDGKYRVGEEYISKIERITSKKIINTMAVSEKIRSDILVIAPCSRK